MLAVAIVPGPSDFLVVGRSLAAGFLHGALVTLGIIAADFLLIGVAILALGAIAAEVGALFYGIQAAGGMFLLGLGIATWRSESEGVGIGDHRSASWASSFSSGLLITLGDPKANFFYMGLLPAFLDLTIVSTYDVLTVMAAATAAVLLVKLSYAFLAARAESFFNDAQARGTVNRIGGAVLGATGLYLLAASMRAW
jgi:threonine/homoserine/homoserine lactone efflux protein